MKIEIGRLSRGIPTQKQHVLLFLFVIFVAGCSSDNKAPDSIPFIDVRKNYPEKEIVLTDIADVSYLYLNTQNENFLHRGGINYATENTFVVGDWSSNSILFFFKDGNPKSRFNRYGQGPEEYYQPDLANVIYDEATDDVYVPVGGRNRIQVYSSTGEYKRQLTLSHGVNSLGSIIVSFDDQSLLIYDSNKRINQVHRKAAGDHSAFSHQMDSAFVLISKKDGKVLKYVEIPSPTVDLSIRSGVGSNWSVWKGYQRIVKCSDGYLLCNPENDTIYLYKKNETLTPILRKIPLLSDGNTRVLGNCLDIGKYQFMKVSNRLTGPRQDLQEEYYMRDKETGEVFRQKITLSDYLEKEFFIHAEGGFTRFLENEYLFVLDLFELKDAHRENRLSGKLKKMVETLNEFDNNNVFMLIHFK